METHDKPPVYHGDNGTQEFWEGDTYLLLRNHAEAVWSVHRKHGRGRNAVYAFLFFCDDAEAAVARAGVRLDAAKVWRRCGRGYTLKDVPSAAKTCT